jgi:hypothetical protein
MQIKDFLGNEITVGCHVVYPVRRGSSMWLNRIKVTQVTPTQVTGYNPDKRLTHIKNLKNVVVVTLPDGIPTDQEATAPQGMEGQ